MQQQTSSGLAAFINQVHQRASQAVQRARLHPGQRHLLSRTLERAAQATDAASYTEPLGLLYLVFKAWGGKVDERTLRVSAACWLQSVAGDLLGLVQNEGGEASGGVGSAVAMNDALALVSVATGELSEGMQLDGDPKRLHLALDAFHHALTVASAMRHRELVGDLGDASAEVLELPRGKAALLGLFLEAGAVLAGCDEEVVASYRYVGEKLGSIVQIVEDLRDVFGPATGDELARGKVTYPLAYFRRNASAEQQQQLDQLLEGLPESVPHVVRLLCESGATSKCEQVLGILRERVHAVIATADNQHPAQRTLLDIVDQLASAVGAPEPLAVSAKIESPGGDFHDRVVWALSRFVERMSPWRVPWPPDLQPWPMPHFSYDSARNIIRCPDVDGMPEEVLPFYVEVFGVGSADEVSHWLQEHLAAVLAREMFRAWRVESQRDTHDQWHEQYVASRLALGYARRFQPDALLSLGRASSTTIAKLSEAHGALAEKVVQNCEQPAAESRFFDLGPYPTLLVQAELMAKLMAEPTDFDADMTKFLGSRVVSDFVRNGEPSAVPDAGKVESG